MSRGVTLYTIGNTRALGVVSPLIGRMLLMRGAKEVTSGWPGEERCWLVGLITNVPWGELRELKECREGRAGREGVEGAIMPFSTSE